MASPTVSIVIPVFNRSQLLRRALASVECQTYRDYRVFVVDDASTESIEEALAGFSNVSLLRHERRAGAAAARNTGIRAATSPFVALLDSDDEWLPRKLERQLEFMSEVQPARAISCTAYLLNRAGALQEREINTRVQETNFLWGCTIAAGSSLLMRREVYDVVGPFDERLRRLEDWDWMLRCSQHYRIDIAPEPLVRVFASPTTAVGEEVEAALGVIEREHGKYGIGWKRPVSVLKFQSSIALEQAAVFYRRGETAKAMRYGLLSLIIYPLRERPFWSRMSYHLQEIVRRRFARRTS